MTTVDQGSDAAEQPRELMPGHLRELEESCISEAVRDARGYETLYGAEGDRARLRQLRLPRWAWRDETAFPALLLPMYRVTGEEIGYQLKPALPQEAPGGKRQKYASQSGVPNHLDVPPVVADLVRDPTAPLWVTEGIKKADCLASLNKATITLTGVFNWKSKHGTLGDWEDIPLAGRAVVICFDSDARDNRMVMLAMQRFGRWLESKQARPLYLIVPEAVEREDGSSVPVKGVDDYFHAGGTMDALKAAARDSLPVDGAKDAAFSDAVLTDTLCAEALEGRYRWARGLGWMKWTGKRWTEASDAAVTEEVRQWALEQFNRTLDEQRRDSSRDLRSQIDGWRSALSNAKIGNLIKLSRGVLECDANDFDNDPDLLNCPNGIVDLRTGVLTPHDPDALMTRMAGADFIKNAVHPDWDKALEALPEDVREWYQIRVGQAFTGHMTPDDMVVICQGGGANGKSTIANALATVAGKRSGYYVMVSDRVILGAASDNHPTEIMDFMGARYAVLEETPEARRLDTNRLKKLAGTPEITGRRIRQDPVTFDATHSMFINSNFKPMVEETDHGTWRRLALLRWPYTYRKPGQPLVGPDDRTGDPTLRERVQQSPQALEAALAWACAGARRWYELEKIMPSVPDAVEADTLAWRKQSDPVLAFLEERIDFDMDACIAGTELRTQFNEWLHAKGAREWGDKTFLSRFEGHSAITSHAVVYKVVKNPQRLSTITGFTAKSGTVRAWLGMAWKQEGPSGPENGENTKDPFSGGDTMIGYGGYTSPVNQKSPEGPTVNSERVTAVTDLEPKIAEDTPGGYPVDPFAEALETDPGTPAPEASEEASQAPAESAPLEPLRGVVAADIETPSAKKLFTWSKEEPYARLSGLRDEDGNEVLSEDPERMVAHLNAAEAFTMHNGLRFDLMALALHHGADYDALAAKCWDTYVDEATLDPSGGQYLAPWNKEGYYGLDAALERRGEQGKTDELKALAKPYGEAAGYAGKEAVDEGFERVPVTDPRYRAYLSGDVRAQGRLHRHQMSEAPERMDYRRREQRVAYIQNRMTLTGWKIDVPLLRERVAEEADKVQRSLEWLHDNAGVPLTETRTRGRGKAKETYEVPRKSPLGSAAGKEAVIEAFRARGAYAVPRTATGVLALNKDALGEGSYMVGKGASGSLRPGMLNPRVLAAFEAHGADTAAIRELCEHIKLVTTSVQKYQEIMNHLIGDRVHGLVGETQGSGRWAMVKPSVTNLGKRGGKVVQRAPFIADDGEVLIAFDLDQVDMRAFAGHCRDTEYVGMFVRGEDPHSMIADMVFGRHDGEWREKAKASGHGWNYGLSVNGLVNSGIERELAERFDAGMQSGYPRLCEWRSDVRARGEAGELLDNGFGRLMRVDPRRAYTQAPALCGQGTARDILVQGLLRLPQEYIPWMRGVVHDEVIFSVPEGRVQECIEVVTAALTMDLAEITNGKLASVPITTGASKAAHSWDCCYTKD